jgi:hypothetical protein
MECYRVQIPDGAKVTGVTAAGQVSVVLPGEYLVHRLPPKMPSTRTLLRFVGADAMGRDVHVPLATVETFLTENAILEPHGGSHSGD